LQPLRLHLQDARMNKREIVVAGSCEPAPPPPVSQLTRLLCEPWMSFKRAVLRPRLEHAVFERIGGRDFIVWPGVFNPAVFRTGSYLANFVARTPLLCAQAKGHSALDVGTGCGILGVFAAIRGYRVTAIDVEPHAVSCARANAILNRVDEKMCVVEGDLFAPVQGQAFDVVLFSLPKFRGKPATSFERALKSPDVIERFAAGLPLALKPDGIALFVLTSHGDPQGMLAALLRTGMAVERITWRHFGVETMAIYAARHPSSGG
jgi:methylase of polypeptide subunit release factors